MKSRPELEYEFDYFFSGASSSEEIPTWMVPFVAVTAGVAIGTCQAIDSVNRFSNWFQSLSTEKQNLVRLTTEVATISALHLVTRRNSSVNTAVNLAAGAFVGAQVMRTALAVWENSDNEAENLTFNSNSSI